MPSYDVHYEVGLFDTLNVQADSFEEARELAKKEIQEMYPDYEVTVTDVDEYTPLNLNPKKRT